MRNPLSRAACLISSVLTLIAHTAVAQSTAYHLPPPNGHLESTFTSVGSVRELTDGRVLITDVRDNRIVVGDFGTREVHPIGHVGHGPHEYPLAVPMVRLGPDSSIMINVLNRWAMFWVGTMPDSTLLPTNPLFQHGYGVVGFDRAYQALVETFSGPGLRPYDSGYAMLVSTNTGATDTVARLRSLTPVPAGQPDELWDLSESARLAPDGYVAVIRIHPFRVDWRSPAGEWRSGAPILDGEIPFDAKEQQAYRNRMRGRGTAEHIEANIRRAPRNIAPYVASYTNQFTPDGSLLIVRVPTAAHSGNWYEVVDRTGRVVRTISLPANEEIAGFGVHSVYVASKDGNDLVTVSRHVW